MPPTAWCIDVGSTCPVRQSRNCVGEMIFVVSKSRRHFGSRKARGAVYIDIETSNHTTRLISWIHGHDIIASTDFTDDDKVDVKGVAIDGFIKYFIQKVWLSRHRFTWWCVISPSCSIIHVLQPHLNVHFCIKWKAQWPCHVWAITVLGIGSGQAIHVVLGNSIICENFKTNIADATNYHWRMLRYPQCSAN